MAVLVGVFTDFGRQWFANVIAGKQFAADPLVIIRNNALGVAGNQPITDTVASPNFVVTGLQGGAALTAALGSIWAIAGNVINDGETFTLNDGVNPAKVFEFDKNGIIVPGHVAVTITNLMSAADVAVAIMNAINNVGPSILNLTASFSTRTNGLTFFRMGEGGFQILPSLEKVPIAASSRKGINGIQAGHGQSGDLTIDPDLAPPANNITVSSLVVPDVNVNLFFVQKVFAPSDITITLVSGVFQVQFNCLLDLLEGNKRYNVQGAGSPQYFEIGIYANEGGNLFEVGYVTFAGQTKVNTASLLNQVIFEI